MQYRRLTEVLLLIVILLLIPLIAMQFTNEIDWDITDFLIMSILMLGSGSLCEIVFRSVKSMKIRIILCIIIFFVIFLIWAELAVGIFGSPLAGS